MEKKEETHNKERFLALLEKHFGGKILAKGGIEFDGYRQKEVAQILTMTPQYLNKLIKPLTLPEDHPQYEKPPSYKFAIERLIQYAKLKEFEEFKKSYKSYRAGIENQVNKHRKRIKLQKLLIILLSMGLIGFIFFFYISCEKVSPLAEKGQNLSFNIPNPIINTNGEFLMYIDPPPTLKTVIRHEGMLTVRSLQLESMLFNDRIKKDGILTRKDSLDRVLELKNMIHRVVKTVRERNLDFQFSNRYSLKKIGSEAVPPETDFLFQCSEELILDAAFNRKSPIKDFNARATPFDDGLVKSLPYLLDREITFDELKDRIQDQVLANQDQIIFAIERGLKNKIKNEDS